MATAVKRKLSGAAAGSLGIEIAATATPGDLIHTAVAGTTAGTFDEIWLWAQNNHTADVVLTVEFGAHDHAQEIKVTIPFKSGLVPVVPGLILQDGKDVNAYAATTAVVTLFGFVNAITD
jgi:ABC-type Fe3+ transport system substrate-binding protein